MLPALRCPPMAAASRCLWLQEMWDRRHWAWFSPARCRMRAVCLQQPQHLGHRQRQWAQAFHCAQAAASMLLTTQTAQHQQPCAQSRIWCDPVLPRHLLLPPWGQCMQSSCTKSPEHALTFCLPSAKQGRQCSISAVQLSACPGNKQGKQSKLQ